MHKNAWETHSLISSGPLLVFHDLNLGDPPFPLKYGFHNNIKRHESLWFNRFNTPSVDCRWLSVLQNERMRVRFAIKFGIDVILSVRILLFIVILSPRAT